MKTVQFDLAQFNPDSMTADELHDWINFIGQGQRPQVAKQWFPGMKGQFKHARAVRNYCWNKVTAIGLRLSGNIQEAMRYEAICERIYGELPDCAKW